MENRCVCCGEIIPEGRQVYPICESGKFSEKERIEQITRRKWIEDLCSQVVIEN